MSDLWTPKAVRMADIDPVKQDYHLRHPINGEPLVYVEMKPPRPEVYYGGSRRLHRPTLLRAVMYTADFLGSVGAVWDHGSLVWILEGNARQVFR